MTAKRLHIVVSGHVQGVCFRARTRDTAQNLSLVGWTKNLRDGAVEILAEGEESDLKKLMEWAHRGPPAAHVTDVKCTWAPAIGEFAKFEITH